MGIHDQRLIETIASLQDKPAKLLIDGQWVDALSGETFATYTPATGQPIRQVAKGGAADIDLAVTAARRALEDGPWARFSPFDRQAVLLKLADLVESNWDQISLIDTVNMGNPITRTAAAKRRAVGLLRYYAGLATAIHGHTISTSQPGDPLAYTLREPVGVVGAINPWNGPIGMAIWKIAPALAAGCTVILKPAEQAPLSPIFLGQLCLDAGVPPGVVNVVAGLGDAGAALAAHPGVDKVAFTGSTGVGQRIIQASAGNVKRVSLELGGKSPNIVFADADLDKAVPAAAMAVFTNSGQICSAGTRLFVEDNIYDEFIERVADFTRSLKVGDPLDPETQLGPVVSLEQMERIVGYIDAGRAQGATVTVGGGRISDAGLENGYFLQPTVFSGVEDDMKIAREEIFGPVISALRFSDIDDVLRRANDTTFGLGSGVWTRDITKANYMSRRLKAGSVWVNCYQIMDPAVPFGGYKMSGYGRESGLEHIEEFLNTKAVWIA
ncbi:MULTISPECIES: aldehyde dehydrogenase family protein [Alphaproteobacteria]|uniref:Aldehyde dehydrogenase n=2 Tax=Alphaproteobacteria TaxID=28211 RepID=A0A512HNQ1_9HYPH|nr:MULTISPECIES: aldehyde dehydrogenase family protein [Alphaproteobacteria]GEO87059.1 aldehyde dehydrogenase [Ciceribacter naphthalenivorans]GLR23155.1 aldehyde dehydrogenase [Ciceribacter naphthalenivorans]GLT06011.1 aldehyde dehydrogenase [Sphingomonas psychrolutea]